MICENCGAEMTLLRIYVPEYGVIYDELEEIKNGNTNQSSLKKNYPKQEVMSLQSVKRSVNRHNKKDKFCRLK